MSESSKNLTGKHRQAYTPSLTGGNPEKTTNVDWWDELCEKHNAKNYWKKYQKTKTEKEADDKKR